jgi:hypothetical protein
MKVSIKTKNVSDSKNSSLLSPIKTQNSKKNNKKNKQPKLSDTHVNTKVNSKNTYVYRDQRPETLPPNQVVSLPMVLPSKMLENTKRPNGYNYIYKDPVEVDVRDENDPAKLRPTKKVFDAYGYSYVPPEFWSVPQNRPPVCIPQQGFKAEALPLYTSGTPLDALELNNSILPKFIYEEVYDPKYYYPGYISK